MPKAPPRAPRMGSGNWPRLKIESTWPFRTTHFRFRNSACRFTRACNAAEGRSVGLSGAQYMLKTAVWCSTTFAPGVRTRKPDFSSTHNLSDVCAGGYRWEGGRSQDFSWMRGSSPPLRVFMHAYVRKSARVCVTYTSHWADKIVLAVTSITTFQKIVCQINYELSKLKATVLFFKGMNPAYYKENWRARQYRNSASFHRDGSTNNNL